MGNNRVVVAGLMIGVVFGLGGAAFAGDPHAVKVSVGYADTFHADAALQYVPSPWLGSPSVTFIGAPRAVSDCGYPNCYDAAAIKLDNPSAQPLTVDGVTVRIGDQVFGTGQPQCPNLPDNEEVGQQCDPWHGLFPLQIPGKSSLILTQTGGNYNFDLSDNAEQGTQANPSPLKPLVEVSVGAKKALTKDFTDGDQILNSGGYDKAAWQEQSEGHPWQSLSRTKN